MKKPGIREWVSGNNLLSEQEKLRIIEDNEHAVATVRKLKLPMDTDFGSFDDLASMEQAVPQAFKQSGLFIIRCPHRTEQIIHRKLFVPWADVVKFVNELPGGYKLYQLGLREVTLPTWSGTIISSSDGASVIIELWEGKHLLMDDGDERTSYRGVYRADPGSPRHYVWSENCTSTIKETALNALRYFAPNLRPNKSFFAEFSVSEQGYRFHGVSFDPYWSERRETSIQQVLDPKAFSD
ncbi:MAG: hypothetical protein KBC33_00005 [Candidatus Pacebacteria bacterium]|nr:hypothetical protein [Candidatus Paceibacterota bacterium]